VSEHLRTRAWLPRGLFDCYRGFLFVHDADIVFESDDGECCFVGGLETVEARFPTLWPGVVLKLHGKEYRVSFVNPYLFGGSVRSVRIRDLKEAWSKALQDQGPQNAG
jgi:hypothetical protein